MKGGVRGGEGGGAFYSISMIMFGSEGHTQWLCPEDHLHLIHLEGGSE